MICHKSFLLIYFIWIDFFFPCLCLISFFHLFVLLLVSYTHLNCNLFISLSFEIGNERARKIFRVRQDLFIIQYFYFSIGSQVTYYVRNIQQIFIILLFNFRFSVIASAYHIHEKR